MMDQIKVLDNGYIKLVESWGSDERIIEAARMSTEKGFLGWGELQKCERCNGSGEVGPWGDSDHDSNSKSVCNTCKGFGEAINKPGDEKLLGYLYKNKHMTPFEMAGCIIEVQAPIFVFREWHRHRSQSYNELSGRYTTIPNLNYIPTVERLLINSKTNKQAGTIKGAAELDEAGAAEYQGELRLMYDNQQRFYEKALQAGVPKELARVHLPVGRYSKMRASTCLRNWLAFMTLRSDAAAQWEIRQYSYELHDILKGLFPRTIELFDS